MKNTCGTCTHWMRYGTEVRGQCLLDPPTVFASGDQRRPQMRENEPACSHHAEGEQAVKEKVQPETPGHAARAARETTPHQVAAPAPVPVPVAQAQPQPQPGRRRR